MHGVWVEALCLGNALSRLSCGFVLWLEKHNEELISVWSEI